MKAAAFTISLFALACASFASNVSIPAADDDTMLVDGVAAFVNGEAITIRDVVTGIPEQLREMATDPAFRDLSRDDVFAAAYTAALEECIDRNLIVQAYWDGEQRIPESALLRTMNEVIESRYSGNVATLQADLAKTRMTYADWKKMMEKQIIIRSMRQTYVSSNIHISPKEIAETYANRKQELSEPEKVHVLTLALTNDDAFKENLAGFRQRLDEKESFESIARDLSVDVMADAGGDYGWIVPNETLAPKLAAAVNAIKDGELSEPVELGQNTYILFRKDSQPAKALTLRDVQEQIERERYEQEATRIYTHWTERLRNTAKIQIFETH